MSATPISVRPSRRGTAWPFRSGLVVAALAASSSFASLAHADPSLAEKATAQALFEDGLQLMGAKRYAEACPKLEESERLDPALGTRFRLSECEEAVGRLASAWAGFLEVADLAKATKQPDREAVARARAATIEPKLSRVKVDVVTPDVPGLEVAHDHTLVGRGQWGTAVPIDAGTYTITATAPGKAPWRGSITVAEDGATASITVPALADAPAGSAAVLRANVSPATSGGSNVLKTAGFTMIGVGVAGLATGVVLGFVAKGNYDGAACSSTTCTAAGESAINSARSLAGAATVLFIAGAAVGAAGTVMVLAAPSAKHEASAELRLAPGAMFVEGRF